MAEYETLVEMFENSREEHASKPYMGVKESGSYEWITYREFGEMVDACRGGLADLGVDRGDTVAIIADNCPQWAAAAHATYGRAARFCPMYEDQSTKDWRYILEDSEAKVVIVADDEIYDQVQPLVDEFETLERIVNLDGADDDPDSWSQLVEAGRDEPVDITHPDKDEIAGFIYTSGTTGQPKGVLLSHWNIASNIQSTLEVVEVKTDDVSLAFLPWAHSFGQTAELHALTSVGASIGLVESVDTIIENLSEVRPTLLFSVPRIFNKIYDGVHKKIGKESKLKQKLFEWAMKNADRLRNQEDDGGAGFFTEKLDELFDRLIFSTIRERFGGRLRYAFSGGAALSPEVARFIDSLHITVYEGYGLTETSPVATCNGPGRRRIGSVGKTIPEVEIKTEPVEGYEDEVGEICIRGPNIMQGYHNMPERTDEVIDDDGWFHTGDLGEIDDDGFLWILGRVKAQYKLENGKYVVPAPVEEQLKLSPHVDQIMIEGEGCPYNVALIVVDEESLTEWADEHDVDYASIEDLVDKPEVEQLMEDEIEEWGAEVKPYELPKRFALTSDEFTPENEMLTPTLKLKRRVILSEYADTLADLYDGPVPLRNKN